MPAAFAQSGVQHCAGRCLQHVPGLRLPGAQPPRRRQRVVRMHLDREGLGRVDDLDEQREDGLALRRTQALCATPVMWRARRHVAE